MLIARIEVFETVFPFKISFGHALASRSSSRNVVVRVTTQAGVVGYGEGVPRDYVTGETPSGAAAMIAEELAPPFVGRGVGAFEELPDFIAETFAWAGPAGPSSAARCAMELAVLDAAGREFGRSVGDLLGPVRRDEVVFSGVLPLLPPPLMYAGAWLYRLYGITTLKLKVGRSLSDDLRNLRLLRAALGWKADLRIDVNCVWQPEQAIGSIKALSRYHVSAVEQPVDKDDFAGLKQVSDAVEVPIMADESLRTLEDAERLARERVVDMFNIRISKCGGLLAARQVAEIAARAGLPCQLGAHPGESDILGAAGRHFAVRTAGLRYCELPGGVLLKEGLARPALALGRGGRAPAPDGSGLGIAVDQQRLERYVTSRRQVA